MNSKFKINKLTFLNPILQALKLQFSVSLTPGIMNLN